MYVRRIIAALSLLIVAGTGCGTDDQSNADTPTVRIATTLHPFAAILRPIVDTVGTVATLLPAGTSPHAYDPLPSHVRQLSRARVLVFGHSHLDGWAADLTSTSRIELFSLVPDSLRRSFPAGIIPEQQRPHEQDPHFWTDPVAVQAMLPELTHRLCKQFADHCEIFEANAARFSDSLDAVDRDIRQKLESLRGKPVVLATPFFQYFLARYDLELTGVIEPVPGSAPPPRILQKIIEAVRVQNVQAIFALPQLPAHSAETVSRSGEVPLYRLDPIGDPAQAKTYHELVTTHADILYKALR